MNEIRHSNNLLVPADKSMNLYEVDIENYNKLLFENITKTYKNTPATAKVKINSEAKSIADTVGLSNRIQQLAEKEAFITLKDHKPNFRNRPSCRLITLAKSKMGHISKAHLENLYQKCRLQLD